MTDNMRIEEAGSLSPGYPEKIRGAVVKQHPRIKDILSGIILLAARAKEPILLAKIHSIIQSMKSHEDRRWVPRYRRRIGVRGGARSRVRELFCMICDRDGGGAVAP